MGLFSDRCEKCGAKVKKAARFCSECGAPPPGAWSKCPYCGKWVGVESSNCWNCGQPLHPEERTVALGGTWQKDADVLAQCFDVGDIRNHLKKGLILSPGTLALLVDGGRLKDTLHPGRHNVDSLGHRINHWGSPPPRTVVLVDGADIVLPIRVDGLRTSEELSLSVYTEVLFRFNEKRAGKFLENFLKQNRQLSYSDLGIALHSGVKTAAHDLANTSTMEDLVKLPERHIHMEDQLQQSLKQTLESCGFELVRVGSVEIVSPVYDRLRQKAGEVETMRRTMEFEHRMRELVASDRMNQFKTEEELQEYAAQLAHERGVSEQTREQELARLRQVHRHELSREDARHQMEAEKQRHAHDLELKARQVDFEIDESLKWLGVREKKEEQKVKAMAQQADLFKGLDLFQLMAILPDDRRDSVFKAYMAKSNMSPEQILALAATEDPRAAESLSRLASSRAEVQDKQLAEQKDFMNQWADRLERIMTQGLKSAGGNTNVYK